MKLWPGTFHISARRMGLAESTVRAIDLRYLERWTATRRQPPLRQMGVDELYRDRKGKFLTVACNLETGELLWFGRERKQETPDDLFRSQSVSRQRKRIEAACEDMWEPFRLSLAQWAPQCKIVHDKLHIMQHANDAGVAAFLSLIQAMSCCRSSGCVRRFAG